MQDTRISDLAKAIMEATSVREVIDRVVHALKQQSTYVMWKATS